MAQKKLGLPITQKVNILILAVLILGIGAITFVLAGSFASTLAMTHDDALVRESQSVYASIETIMLPGQASLAEGLMERLAEDNEIRVAVFRADGTEAFRDNKTIMSVNTNLGRPVFTERINPSIPRTAEEESLFQRAALQPNLPAPVFTSIIEDASYMRMFLPLINLPKCTNCHGSDHTVRGIIDVSFDITQSQQLQQASLGQAAILFVLTVGLSSLLLSWFMNRSILHPLTAIGAVCGSVRRGDFVPRVAIQKKDEIGELAQTVNQMIDGLVERLKLAKYVSTSTIASLQEEESSKRISRVLFFSDIRGFTSYSEKNDPQDVVHALNHILGIQTTIIQNHGGDIDKYVGDEVMALFEGHDAHIRGINAALAIQAAIAHSNAQPDQGCKGLEIGVGLHYGEVILGRIGTETRADFTVIGDTVNLAARLCSAAGKGEILISKDLALCVKQDRTNLMACKFQGPISMLVKGKEQKAVVFKVWSAGL